VCATEYAAKYSLYKQARGSRVAGGEVGNESSDPRTAAKGPTALLWDFSYEKRRGDTTFEVRKQQSWVNSRIDQEIGNHVDSQ
jgi:hypothetical protein